MLKDLLLGSANLGNAAEEVAQVPGALVLDCKSLFDSVGRSESSALGMSDKRAAIEALSLKRSVTATGTQLRWVHSEAQLADVMTKGTGPGKDIFLTFLRRGFWTLVQDAEMRSARKRAKLGIDILESKALEDNPFAGELDVGVSSRKPSVMRALAVGKHSTYSKALSCAPVQSLRLTEGVCECASVITACN